MHSHVFLTVITLNPLDWGMTAFAGKFNLPVEALNFILCTAYIEVCCLINVRLDSVNVAVTCTDGNYIGPALMEKKP